MCNTFFSTCSFISLLNNKCRIICYSEEHILLPVHNPGRAQKAHAVAQGNKREYLLLYRIII